jgi:hypothetical protein
MKRLITEVATYSHEMFSLRFEQAGSLYQSSTSTEFFVGPIISSPFYRALDGFVRIENASPLYDLSPFRGPFSAVSDYLSSSLRAELHTLSREPSTVLSELDRDRKRLRRGQRVLEKATELCAIYPGDMQIYGGAKAPLQRFSLKLDDFRLSNIMVRSRVLSIWENSIVCLDRQAIWKNHCTDRFRGNNYRSTVGLCRGTPLDFALKI